MTKRYSNEYAGRANSPIEKVDGRKCDVTVKCVRATITLASQPVDVDGILVAQRPAGTVYLGHEILSSVTLGASTIALGTAAVPAKYRAAATFTAVDTITPVALAAQVAAEPLAAVEDIILSVTTAALPAAGTLIINTYYGAPH